MSEVTVRFATSGMHCGSCAMLIDMTLRDVEGVSLARTDHTSGETVVTYDDDLVSVDALVEAVRGVGYEASPK